MLTFIQHILVSFHRSSAPLSSCTPKIGTAMTEIMKIKASSITRGDYLSNFFMRVSRSFMPK